MHFHPENTNLNVPLTASIAEAIPSTFTALGKGSDQQEMRMTWSRFQIQLQNQNLTYATLTLGGIHKRFLTQRKTKL